MKSLKTPNIIEDWLLARPFVLPVIDMLGGTHTETDVVYAIIKGEMKLWLGKKCALITEFRQYPRMLEISVFAAGGDMSEIMEMKVKIEKFGKDNGCARSRIEGRKGWERVHPDYRFLGMTLVKEL